jgi:hypothetical protein
MLDMLDQVETFRYFALSQIQALMGQVAVHRDKTSTDNRSRFTPLSSSIDSSLRVTQS